MSDREMLADLTCAYINERYGERQAELQQHIDSPTWLSRLAERLGETWSITCYPSSTNERMACAGPGSVPKMIV